MMRCGTGWRINTVNSSQTIANALGVSRQGRGECLIRLVSLGSAKTEAQSKARFAFSRCYSDLPKEIA